jgi:hypothetical protein
VPISDYTEEVGDPRAILEDFMRPENFIRDSCQFEIVLESREIQNQSLEIHEA